MCSKKPKIVWKTIHRILKPSPKTISACPNELNNFFADIAENLTGKKAEQITKSSSPDETDAIFKMKRATYYDIRKELTNLRNDCSTGFDTIPAKFIKPVAEYLASPLTHVVNNCIKKQSFPKLWKTAKICPIPKVSSPIANSDYRPISILPILSKVFERIILNQLKSSLERHQIFQDTQSGYRQGHSCVTLLHKLCNDIQSSFKKSEVTLTVMADYSKAFDTVSYSILVKKLKKLKFSNSFINLIIDYLSDRHQFVQIDDKKSVLRYVKYGVPQGSILGPTLFNLYVYDLAENTQSSSIQFADDTTFYRSCKATHVGECAKQLENDITSIGQWSKQSNLIFNDKKTKSMLLSTNQMSRRHKLDDKQKFVIRNNGKELERVSEMKLLGITIQENLKWNQHVNELLKTSYSTLRTLRHIKRMTSFNLRKNLVEALIHSKVDYAITVYGNNLQQYLKKRIQKLMNSSAGYVYNRFATTRDVVQLKWLPFDERVAFSSSKLAFKSVNDSLWPKYLKTNLKKPKRALRNQQNDEFSMESGMHEKTFSSIMSHHYNDLPLELRKLTEAHRFNVESKKYFIDKSYAKFIS